MAEPAEKKLNPEPKANNNEEGVNQEPISIDKPSEGGGGGGGGGGGLMGYLDVFVHQARDIHNICIYHKQDVYAKLSLTADSPAAALSTRIVNGGGRNPVFNQSLRLAVRSSSASALALRCEIWMLSRVKNYLQDQLLGFALIPLADVLTSAAAGKLVAAEFPLSSSDLFHSPSGFVHLSLSYVGSSPEVMPISPPPPLLPHSETTDDSIPCEYEKVEFPDLNVVKENNIMVSEYFGIDLDAAQSAESLLTAENGNCPDREAGVRVVESFSTDNSVDSVSAFRNETPLSSVTTTDSPVVPPSTPQSADPPSEKEKVQEATEGQAESSSIGKSSSSSSEQDSVVKPIISINIEPEETTVVQQDIVDMYMKSMQQFTESLAKMKLPMDIENKSGPNSENGESSSEKKVAPSKGTGPKVFYGSRAFF